PGWAARCKPTTPWPTLWRTPPRAIATFGARAAATIAVVMATAMAVVRSMVLFLPKPSIPPAMLVPAADPRLNAGSPVRDIWRHAGAAPIFPTALSGGCKQTNAQYDRARSCGTQRCARTAAGSYRIGWRLTSHQEGIRRASHRLLRRLHDRRRSRRLCHRPRHRDRVRQPREPHRLPCSLLSVLMGSVCACVVADKSRPRRTAKRSVDANARPGAVGQRQRTRHEIPRP